MALADFSALKQAHDNPAFYSTCKRRQNLARVSTPSFHWLSLLRNAALNGYPALLAADPSTSVALDNTSGIGIQHPGVSGRPIISSLQTWQEDTGYRMGNSFMLADRLVHQGGLVGNVITLQTTNLPTAALTRHTSGVGVLAALTCYSSTSVISAPTTITVVYTNQNGTGGRTGYIGPLLTPTSQVWTAGLTAFVTLQTGDTGVRSVESVQLDVAMAAAGNFGVTLYKPVAIVRCGVGKVSPSSILGWNTGWDTDACLELLQGMPSDVGEFVATIIGISDV